MTRTTVLMMVMSMAVSRLAVAPSQTDGLGWELVSADLDVRVDTDSSLTLAGMMRLRLGGNGSWGPALAFGSGMTFDSVAGPAGSLITMGRARDTTFVRLPAAAHRGAQITVRAWWRAPSRVGRQIAVGRDGAFASWGAGWYPVPAVRPGDQPSLLVAGTTRISVPTEWRTLSNGLLVDSTASRGVRTETWRATQAVARSFIAGPYTVRWRRVDDARIGVFLSARHAGRAAEYAEAIPRFVGILADRFGPYPFQSFGIAEVPRSLAPPGFGGRSEQGYFLAHTDAFEAPGVNVSLFAHELAHMWFPNLVDSRSPGDDMMDEAIASYGVALVLEATAGDSAATAELVDGNPDFSERAYFQYVRLGMDEPLMADYSPLIARAKGPMVYRMLRERVGDRAFFGTIRAFARTYAGRGASLADLRQAFVRAVPGDTGLAQFFAQWLDRTGAPVPEMTWEPVETPGRPQVRVRVVQGREPYRLPLELVVRGAGGPTTQTVSLVDSTQTFVLDSPGRPSDVLMDPGHRLLLWRPEFGPPGGGPHVWSQDRWRAWLDDQARWLMQRYGVERTEVSVADSGRIAWRARYGGQASEGAVDGGQALLASLAAGDRPDSLRVTWDARAERVTLFTGISAAGQGALIAVRGGWGGRQLALHLAQEIAVRYAWHVIPR